MAKFETREGKLFLDGKEVLRGWESLTGWFWFATEKVQEQMSLIDGKEVNDTMWFGFVQGFLPKCLKLLVGARGFEPPTPCSQMRGHHGAIQS
jgi:hypothetical protein